MKYFPLLALPVAPLPSWLRLRENLRDESFKKKPRFRFPFFLNDGRKQGMAVLHGREVFLRSERCFLTPFMPGDVARAKEFLQDIDVMYAWEHAFSDGEVREMVARSMEEQEQWGYSFMLACLAESGEAIGRVGLRNDSINGRDVVELGYILSKKYWGKGYATELGAACLDYGFHVLGFNRIVAEIRPENTASLSVARRLGMVRESSFLKQCLGREIPHDCYVIDRGNAEANIPTIH